MTKSKLSQKELLKAIKTQANNHLIDFSIATNPQYKPNWHHEEIANQLERIESGQFIKDGKKILMVFMPPRHGKSEECTINFPAWYLGRNPTKEIITASYSSDLAVKFGGKTRDLVNGKAYKSIFPNVSLKKGEEGKAEWMTNSNGSYVSVGVGGATTGKGANCFIYDTLITSEYGKKPIQTCIDGERVLSYNYDKNTLEWQPIKATRKRVKRRFIEITTDNGRKVTSTDDHLFFVSGKGYIKAKELREGQRLWTLSETSNSVLLVMWKGISERVGRICKNGKEGAEGLLLRKRLFSKTSFLQEFSKVQMREVSRQAGQEVLFRMQTSLQEIKRYSLQILWSIIQTIKSFDKILFNGMQEQLSFAGNDREKSQLEARTRNEQISERVSEKKISGKEGQGQEMRSVWHSDRTGITSQRLQPQEQRGQQLSNSLQELSYNSSQIQEDAISSITSFEEEQDVYDIQVEKNHNFFAEDILVHNCFLIDDPIKNAEESESEVFREKVWDWFLSVVWTRLEPNGVVIVILTRWHLDDLAGRILKNDDFRDICEIISYPAIAEINEKHRKVGEALWEWRYSVKELERNKVLLGSKNFAALYQQHPIAAENQEFKPHWFKEREREDIKGQTRRFLTIDTAISKKASADYTGICDNTVDTSNYWNLKAWKVRVDPLELMDLLFTLHNNNRYEKIGIEKTIYLDAIKPFLDEEQRKRNAFLPIVELKHNQVNKEIRIRGLIPRYESGSIFHLKGECSDLEEELMAFPQAVHDDVCLVGDTLIAMGRGYKKIKDIRAGDKVMTRIGLKRVLWAGQTGIKETINRIGITGTENHPVITKLGQKSLQDINVSDTIYIWNEKQSCIKERNIIDIQAHQGDSIECIFGDTINGKNHHSHFIDKFGLITMGKYLKNILFTIKTVIHSIMTFQILNLSLIPNTQNITAICQKELKPQREQFYRQLKKHQNGIEAKKEELGIENIGKKQLERVYNLKVEKASEFFANNVLVHNCDATAYQVQIARKPYEPIIRRIFGTTETKNPAR